MKRDNIKSMVGWLDALRRDHREALLATLDPAIVWQGLRDEWVCNGPDEVVRVFTTQRDEAREPEALELIGAERQTILHTRGGGALASELKDGIQQRVRDRGRAHPADPPLPRPRAGA
jgi:hypothetical protein